MLSRLERLFLQPLFVTRPIFPRLSEAFQERAFCMSVCDLSPDGWALTSPDATSLLAKLQDAGTRLGELEQDTFYFGIKTGCNDAFIIDASTREYLVDEDAGSDELIKPLLKGRNLRRWKAESANEYLITIASSTNREWPWSDASSNSEAEQIFAEVYPMIYQHLSGYRDRLVARDDQGVFYWELRSCSYYDEFEKPKIIYPDISPFMRACYDVTNAFCLQTTYILPTEGSLLTCNFEQPIG